ncbi:glycosyltransferase family 2 protein (plasmid) [Gluconobacter sphaericus]|uniref:glycosyltransferase family 2 protein n=1 Tax=Gluconobacter sphaericus TaxID=574987 RepID=UPI00192081CE|nr:glycosyltransferase family 2 protein [Gluconobacter sphaericus]QQX92803.1 glycosyltransferase family 2 protein [Gluconobacter sphaericus]
MMKIFKLKTFHGKILSIDNNMNISSGTKEELIFIEPNNFINYIFCTTKETEYKIINLNDSNLKGGMIIFEYKKEGDYIYLIDPISKKYVCSLPKDHNNKVIGNVKIAKEWEKFTIIPIENTTEYTEKNFNFTSGLSPNNIDYLFISDLIKKNTFSKLFSKKILDAFSIFMKMEDFQLFNFILSKDKKLLDKFNFLYENDIWNKSINSMKNNKIVELNNELDIKCIINDKNFSSFPHAIQFFTKTLMPSEFGPSLLSSCRNEGIYLIEWVAYHRAIGFENIYIYSNDNIDGSDELLSLLNKYGYINYVKNDIKNGISAQNNCYNHCLNFVPSIIKSSWVLVIDTDEFICFDHDKFQDITDYINWATIKKYDSISLNWRNISSSPIKNINEFQNKISLRNQNYLPRGYMGDGDRMVKSFFNPRTVITTNPHHPIPSNKYSFNYGFSDGCEYKWHRSPEGFYDNPLFSDEISFDNSYIAHYFFKSASEWFWKNLRNRGDNQLLSGISFENLSQDRIDLFKRQTKQDNYMKVNNDPNSNINEKADKIIDEILLNKDINYSYQKILNNYLAISRKSLIEYKKLPFYDDAFLNMVANEIGGL